MLVTLLPYNVIQIKVYTVSGGKPPDWNPQQQASASVLGFTTWGAY